MRKILTSLLLAVLLAAHSAAFAAATYVQTVTNWGESSPITSGNFTPNAGDTILPVAWDGYGNAITISGTGTYSTLTPPGAFDDQGGDSWLTAANSSATATSQTITITATAEDPTLGWAIDYSGVTAISSAKTLVTSPGTGTGAVAGSSVSVPTGSVLVAFCMDIDTTGTLTTTGTSRGSGTSAGGEFSYVWGEWAGSGGNITPTFTTAAGSDDFVVIQYLLTGSGGGGATILVTPSGSPIVSTSGSPLITQVQEHFGVAAALSPLAWIIEQRRRLMGRS